MDIQAIRNLYEYNDWANQCILETAARLDPAYWTQPAELSYESLRGILVHTLSAEWIWRMRTQERASPTAMPAGWDSSSLESLRALWQEEENRMRAYLVSLDDQALGERISYRNTRGVPFERPLWQILVHVINHGTQHRSEAALVLTSLGFSPGDLDMVTFWS